MSYDLVSDIDYLIETHEFMNDEHLSKCMDRAVRILARSDDEVPTGPKLGKLIADLGAYGFLFRMGYNYYMGRGKAEPDAALKKNTYRSAYEGIDRLCDSMKYLAKSN